MIASPDLAASRPNGRTAPLPEAARGALSAEQLHAAARVARTHAKHVEQVARRIARETAPETAPDKPAAATEG